MRIEFCPLVLALLLVDFVGPYVVAHYSLHSVLLVLSIGDYLTAQGVADIGELTAWHLGILDRASPV